MATRRRTRARRAPCGPRAAAPRARQAGRETRGSAAGLVGASSGVLRRCWRMRRTTLSASVLCESLATRAAVVVSACVACFAAAKTLYLVINTLAQAAVFTLGRCTRWWARWRRRGRPRRSQAAQTQAQRTWARSKRRARRRERGLKSASCAREVVTSRRRGAQATALAACCGTR